MANVKTASLGLISFLMGLFFLVLPAWAENWVEVTSVGGVQTFYDSDSAYVDNATGLAVVEYATLTSEDSEWAYTIYAFDCSRGKIYFLALFDDQKQTWKYDIYGEIDVLYVSDSTSPASKILQWICFTNLPSGNIPFDFKISNY